MISYELKRANFWFGVDKRVLTNGVVKVPKTKRVGKHFYKPQDPLVSVPAMLICTLFHPVCLSLTLIS